MLALRLTFPWGRYCAHPWGLNPARLREAEWPPSPWRLLRALAAGWFRVHCGEPPTPQLTTLLETFGRELPEIAVGPVSFSQTVHWQPNFGAAGPEEKAAATYRRARHENHFAATESPVIFRWQNVVLDERQRELLSEILPSVSYFGRAESLCTLTLDYIVALPEGWCKPCVGETTNTPIRRIAENCRAVFCPDPSDFQASDLWSRRAKRHKLSADLAPPHLVEDLLSHQPLPDGACWFSYEMPRGWPGKWVVRVAKTTRRKPIGASATPRVARYLRFSLQCRVPIPVTFTVPLAEQFRAAALFHFSKVVGDNVFSFALSGHGKPAELDEDHQHAFYLPLGSDSVNSGLLNEINVWCPYGLTQVEVESLMRVQPLHWAGGRYPIRPVLLEIANAIPAGRLLASGQITSRIWRSRTPFVPPRYFYRGNLHGAKLKAKDAPERQLAQCLWQAGATTPGEIRRFAPSDKSQRGPGHLSTWDIVRASECGEEDLAAVSVPTHVPKDGARGNEATRRVGIFFEVEFDSPEALRVPALGHSCHFGLGLFVPASGD